MPHYCTIHSTSELIATHATSRYFFACSINDAAGPCAFFTAPKPIRNLLPPTSPLSGHVHAVQRTHVHVRPLYASLRHKDQG